MLFLSFILFFVESQFASVHMNEQKGIWGAEPGVRVASYSLLNTFARQVTAAVDRRSLLTPNIFRLYCPLLWDTEDGPLWHCAGPSLGSIIHSGGGKVKQQLYTLMTEQSHYIKCDLCWICVVSYYGASLRRSELTSNRSSAVCSQYVAAISQSDNLPLRIMGCYNTLCHLRLC